MVVAHSDRSRQVDAALRRSDTSSGGDADGRISMEEFQVCLCVPPCVGARLSSSLAVCQVVFAMIDRFMKMQLCLEQTEATEDKVGCCMRVDNVLDKGSHTAEVKRVIFRVRVPK